jgi:hypothetical protein
MAKARTQQKLAAAARAGLGHGGHGFAHDNFVNFVRRHRRRWTPEFLLRVLHNFRHWVMSYGENLKLLFAFQPPKPTLTLSGAAANTCNSVESVAPAPRKQ